MTLKTMQEKNSTWSILETGNSPGKRKKKKKKTANKSPVYCLKNVLNKKWAQIHELQIHEKRTGKMGAEQQRANKQRALKHREGKPREIVTDCCCSVVNHFQ